MNCCVPFFGTKTNSTDPDQMPQSATSDQGIHFLRIEISSKRNKTEKENGLVHFVRTVESTRFKSVIWVYLY